MRQLPSNCGPGVNYRMLGIYRYRLQILAIGRGLNRHAQHASSGKTDCLFDVDGIDAGDTSLCRAMMIISSPPTSMKKRK